MKKPQWFNIISLFISLLSVAIALIEFKFIGITQFGKIVYLSAFTALFSFFVVMFFLFSKNKKNIQITLLGQVSSGKTFYLYVLFDYLQSYENAKYDIYPLGKETFEMIDHFTRELYASRRFSCTIPNFSRTAMQCQVEKKTLFKKKCTFQIYDSAGEQFDDLSITTDNKKLHENVFFDRYVLSSNLIFLIVPIDVIWGNYTDNRYYSFEKMISCYIATLQIISDNQGAMKSTIPVAIIFSKTDLLKFFQISEEQTIEKCAKLISVAKKRFRFSKTFFVSSILQDSLTAFDDFTIKPDRIEAPLIWYLEHFN